ncbi:hypothetical protein JCM5353_006309 [Sporobolomyces roseus]
MNERAGFLSNFEVLQLLTSQRTTTEQQIKVLHKRQREKKDKGLNDSLEVSEADRIRPQDLHTVTFEAIRYLEEGVHPILRQSEESIGELLDQLDKLDLTKSERLQLINTAPTTSVELHVCIEDLSERFPSDEQQEHILSIIRSHLDHQPSAATTTAKAKAEREELDKGEEGVADDGDAYEEDAFVQEGGRRGAGGEERDIDEDVEEV